MADAVTILVPVFSSLHRLTAQKLGFLSGLFGRTDQKDKTRRRRRRRKGFPVTSGRSWNWSATGDGDGRVTEICVGLESVAVETEIFSSSEVECAATWGVEEASCVEGTAGEEGDALWGSAPP